MQRWKDQYRTEGFLVGLLVGAASAALASLLFAPKAGKELRKEVSRLKGVDKSSKRKRESKGKGE